MPSGGSIARCWRELRGRHAGSAPPPDRCPLGRSALEPEVVVALPRFQGPQLAGAVDVIEHHRSVGGEALGERGQRRIAAERELGLERGWPVDQQQVDARWKRAQRAVVLPLQAVARERVRLERRERDPRDLGEPCGDEIALNACRPGLVVLERDQAPSARVQEAGQHQRAEAGPALDDPPTVPAGDLRADGLKPRRGHRALRPAEPRLGVEQRVRDDPARAQEMACAPAASGATRPR